MLNVKKLVIIMPLIGIISPLKNSYSSIEDSVISTPGFNLLSKAKLIGPSLSARKIKFTVHINLRNKEEFDALYHEIYNPSSARYHQYLSNKEYKNKFAPEEKTLTLIQQYFINKGMKAEIFHDDIQVEATVSQIEHIFNITINNYFYRNQEVYSNATEPKVDRTIAPYVLGISGLNNIPRFHPGAQNAVPLKDKPTWINLENQKTLSNLAWDSFLPLSIPTAISLNGFTGKNLRTTYNLAAVPAVNGTIIDGTGQTVIILDECGANDPTQIMNDANLFSSQNGLPLLSMSNPGANFAVVDKHGKSITHCERATGFDWALEIANDIEAVHTIAPKANIVLVIDNNLDIGTVLDTIGSSHSFAGFSNTNVISNSWDDNGQETYNAPLEIKFQKAAMNGLSTSFCTSDCGDQTYTNGYWPCSQVSTSPTVEYPASSPNVIAVGGTSMFVDNNWNYSFETGWGSYAVNGIERYPSGFLSGSTGGISQIYPAPPWQQNSTFQGFTAGGYGVIGSFMGGGKRALPDIAMLADLFTGFIIYEHTECPQGCRYGGTSLAAPLFSGTLALVNQMRSLQGKSTIGLASQPLYTANQILATNKALNFITPPHQVIDNSQSNPIGAPLSAFTLIDTNPPLTQTPTTLTFNWDSSLTMNENQFWNDVVGVGSPYIPNFVSVLAAQ